MSLIVSSTTDSQAEVDAAAGLEPQPVEEQEQQQPEAAEPKPKQPPKSVPPDEEEEEPGEETPPEEEGQPVRARGRGGFQRKIERLQRANDYLAQRNQELDQYLRYGHQQPPPPQPQQPAQPHSNGRPHQDQFQSYEEFTEALTDWKVEQAMQKRTEQERQQAAAYAQQQQVSSWHERVGSFRSEAPDFDEVLADVDHIQVPQVLQQALMRDKDGPKLAYELARQPEKFAELARLDPLAQLTALGELKASLHHAAAQAAPPPRPKAVSQAPAPIRPVGQGAAASTVPYDQLPYRDYARRRNADIKARQER